MTKYISFSKHSIAITPPIRVTEIGRKLRGSFSLNGLKSQLNPGEVVVGHYYNGSFWSSPVMQEDYVFDTFESSSLESAYYAVNVECVD